MRMWLTVKSLTQYAVFAAALCGSASAQTIFEKKAGFSEVSSEMTPEMAQKLQEVNREIKNGHDELQRLYSRVAELYLSGASEADYQQLLVRINVVRKHIGQLQENWRELSVKTGHTEAYALWHQPETTLGQLVMDYGAEDYVYLMTPDIATMKLSVDSNLLIPRASWGRC